MSDSLFATEACESRDWRALPTRWAYPWRRSCWVAAGCRSSGKHPSRPGCASDLIVRDLDPRNAGRATLAQVERDLGCLPPTTEAATARRVRLRIGASATAAGVRRTSEGATWSPQRGRRAFPGPEVEQRARSYARRLPPAISRQDGHRGMLFAGAKIAVGFGLGAETAFRVRPTEGNPPRVPAWDERDAARRDHQARGSCRLPLGSLVGGEGTAQ